MSDEAEMDVHEVGDVGSFEEQEDLQDTIVFEEDAEDEDDDVHSLLEEETDEDTETDNYELTANVIQYSEQCLPPRQLRRNIVTENLRPLVNPAS